MTFSVKNKIRLGTLFLFLLLLISGGMGIYSTAVLKQDSREVLMDNYESISYGLAMLRQLDSMEYDRTHRIAVIETMLIAQEKNITEKGERETTRDIRILFDKVKQGDTSINTLGIFRHKLQNVISVNMNAIYQKNVKAGRAAERAMTIIITLAGVIFIIAFTFSVNFPSIVARPIRQLSDAINEIANKNYKHRIHLDNKDEFAALATAFNNMAERLQYFESSNLSKLMFEKSRAESVINSLKDASIGIDRSGTVLFANHEALLLLGLKSADIVGRSVTEVADKNDLLNYLVNEENSGPFKVIVDKKENYFVREAIEVEQSEAKSRVIVLRNITSFKELDVAKTNFIATISHELKTPLAASDFSLKLLEDERIGQLSDEQKSLVQSLKQDNQRILKIISELLNLSQVETGKIQLDIQAVSPDVIITKAVETIQSAALEKNISVERNMDSDLSAIKADPDKTTWVLNNLLTNAVRHSSKDSRIVISVSKGIKEVIFSVQDHGHGIAAEYLSRLFDRYFQVPGSNSKGTGLGLAISKEFIESQNGKIWVESTPGKGSIFSFSIPMV